MTYSFARCDNRLEAPDFDPSYRDASFFGSTAGSYLKHAPWVNNLMQALPDSVARLLHPAMASFIAQKRVGSSPFPRALFSPADNFIEYTHTNILPNIRHKHKAQRPLTPHNIPLNSRLQASSIREIHHPPIR